MKYRLDLGGWNGVFVVPSSLVDRHLKLCGGNELKVILWVLRHGGEPFSPKEISEGTGVRESLAEEAVEYWIQQGLLKQNGESLIQAPEENAPRVSAPKQEETPARQEPLPEEAPSRKKGRMLRPDGVYIAQRMRECPELAALMRETEAKLGKTLSPSLAAVLLNAHDDYGLPCEVVLLIVSYASSINRTTTPYIEAMTREWAESAVFTIPEAENKIRELERRRSAWSEVSRILQIAGRMPSKKEEELSYRWVCTLSLGEDLILESYERCVNHTGKLQMSYMDKILSAWAKQGFTDLGQVREYEEKLREKKGGSQTTFDLDALDQVSYFDLNQGTGK